MFDLRGRGLKTLFADAGANRRGNVAIIFALCLIPIALLIGGAIDLRRALSSKSYLQDAADSAVLAGAKAYYINASLPASTRKALAQAAADKVMNALLASHPKSIETPNWILSENDSTGEVTLTATANSPAAFGGLFKMSSVPMNAVSVATAGGGIKLELALVLDNTGSMGDTLGSSNKLTALKSAANKLVDTLAAAAGHTSDPDAVKIAVAPFSMTVNVGSTYQNASWMTGTQPAAYGADVFTTPQNRFTMLSNMSMSWAGCVELRPAPYDIQDTAPNAGQPATLFVPYFAPDEPDDKTVLKSSKNGVNTYYTASSTSSDFPNNYILNDFPTYSPSLTYALNDRVTVGTQVYKSLKAANKNHSPATNATWWSAISVTDWQTRQGNPSKYVTGSIKGGASGTGSIGPNRDCSMTPILRLTNSFTTVKSKISAMQAVGNTNVPMGMVWGWHLLSPNAPFSDGKAYGTPDVAKVVVLLTDGDNTNDEYSNPENSIYLGVGYIWQGRLLNAANNPLGSSSTGTDRRDAMDSRLTKVCANMKTQKITIYTIGVGVSSHSGSILQGCATDADKYYSVTDAAQLDKVFGAIAASISNLRLSH